MASSELPSSLPQRQEELFLHPQDLVEQVYTDVYLNNRIEVGWPLAARRIFEHIARPHTVGIVGAELGDEGKGRIVDNKLQAILSIKGVALAYVDRFNGGSNAGHTTEKDDVKVALHQVPSGVLHPEVIGIMDTGMCINPIDLMTEVNYVESLVGDTRGKLILSESAILNTDLERAEEQLNRQKQGKAKGGTGRGIGPSYAHHYDRLGLHIADLMTNQWRDALGAQYDLYQKELALFEFDISQLEVPDLEAFKKTGKASVKKIGSKDEFLDRLEQARTWLIDRNMVQNTFLVHQEIFQDLSRGIVVEMAQAVGLDPWLGTLPDVTSSNTTLWGIAAGTGFLRPTDIADRIGIFKITYTSSVGARRMPTHAEDDWAAWTRNAADEFGTTTRRPRDILHLDLELIRFNARMGGIEVLAGTHLDIAQENQPIKVCTHYERNGIRVPYQPGLQYQAKVEPKYIELPGWNGNQAAQARSFDDLPDNAKKFLAFVQRMTGFPIVVATNGPKRDSLIPFPGYNYQVGGRRESNPRILLHRQAP